MTKTTKVTNKNQPLVEINDLSIFFMSLMYFILIFLSGDMLVNGIAITSAMLYLSIVRVIRVKYLIIFALYMLPAVLSVFITSVLYSSNSKGDPICVFLGINIFYEGIQTGIFLAVRSFSLSFISFSFATVIDFRKLVYGLMQILKLPVNIGYPLLSLFDTFSLFRDDFYRIRTASLIRFGKKGNLFFQLIPILVSAARHSYYLGLSMHTRGLNKDKTFLYQSRINVIDIIFVIANLITVILILTTLIRLGIFQLRVL